MSLASPQQAELCDLIDAMYEHGLDSIMRDRLESLLLADDDACRYYLDYSFLHGVMTLTADGQSNEQRLAETEPRRVMNDELPGVVESGPWAADDSAPNLQVSQPQIPDHAFPPIIIESPSPSGSSLLSFVNSMLFSYLTAAVIVGVGMLIAGAWRLSESPQVVRHSSRPVTEQRSLSLQMPDPTIVGRITGMVDCKWADTDTKAFNGAHVPLGRRYALVSGLMEITYDTGAKVILQGPVTYEVKSAAGGYLSVGKLAAKLAKRAEGGGRKADSPLSPFSTPLFSVWTPTAIVTDLGTEFGVEVSQEGQTTSHVFRGVVEVEPCVDGQRLNGRKVRLTANESVHIEKCPNGVELNVRRGTADAAAFVRTEQLSALVEEQRLTPLHRWQTYSRQLRKDPALVAYYTFESAGKDNSILPNVSAAGSVLDGQVDGAEWVLGRWPEKFALYFHGADTNNKVVLPEQERFKFTKPFSVAVWFQASRFQGISVPSLISKGAGAWRIQGCGNGSQCLNVNTTFGMPNGRDYPMPPATIEVTDGRWHLVVAVIHPGKDSHHKRLYVDGRMDGEIAVPAPIYQSDEAIWMGMSSVYKDRDYQGRIDEVVILARPMSAEEVAAMFTAGYPGR
jgi:hypothetical protein